MPRSALLYFFFSSSRAHRDLHSFPTRRSSDLPPRPVRPLMAMKSALYPFNLITLIRLQSLDMRNQSYQRSEEHTSELQSHSDLVCRLLLEKKKNANSKLKHNTTTAIFGKQKIS